MKKTINLSFFRRLQSLSIFLIVLLTLSCEKEEEITTPTINTSEITDVTPTTAMCGGYDLSDKGATISLKGVCWSVVSNPTIDDEFTNNGSGEEDFSSLLADLLPGTTYYARAYATNTKGTSYGDEKSFITVADLPTINTSEITDITPTTAMCGGYDLSDEGIAITAKGVCWSTTNNPTIDDEFTNNGSGEEDFESILADLLPGTTYYVRAYATNNKGTSYGDEKSFTTITGFPLINTSEIDDITTISASCGGYELSDQGATITAKGVCWSTIANPSLNDEFTNNGIGDEDFESVLVDLLHNTTYYVRAYATNGLGTSYGEQKIFTTLNTVYNGDVDLLHQTEVNDFGAYGYTEITGNLEIYGGPEWNYPDVVSDLSPLASLKKVHGDYILSGLVLPNCEEFGIEHVGGNLGFNVYSQYNVDMLLDLRYVGGNVSISGNPWDSWVSIYDLNGLSNIDSFRGDIYLNDCHIINLDVFSSLIEVNGNLSIKNCYNLRNIDGLENIEHIYGSLILGDDVEYNAYLSNLNALSNLVQVDGDLTITYWFELTDFCGLENLIINGGLAGNYSVYDNLQFNPTQQDILDGNCSL